MPSLGLFGLVQNVLYFLSVIFTVLAGVILFPFVIFFRESGDMLAV